MRAKERDYLEQLAEAHSFAKRQKTDIRSLEGKIDSLDEELADNKMKLSASEGRVNGLENEMVKTEGRLLNSFEFKMFCNKVEDSQSKKFMTCIAL